MKDLSRILSIIESAFQSIRVLVIGDVMYVHSPFPNVVYALDLNNDGKILWKYEPKQDPNVIPVMCCDTVNRGVAYGDGKLILNQADTTIPSRCA